jgi:hypothetical protein
MKNKLRKIILFIALCITGILSYTAYAQVPENKPNPADLLYKFVTEGAEAPTSTDYIASLPEGEPAYVIGKVVFYMLIIANFLAFISFVISGVMMITTQGNEEKLTKAKGIFTYTLLAMIICATALALVLGITRINFF